VSCSRSVAKRAQHIEYEMMRKLKKEIERKKKRYNKRNYPKHGSSTLRTWRGGKIMHFVLN